VAPVLTLEEALEHPHNVARGSFAQVAGAPMPGPVPRFSRTPGAVGEVAEVGSGTAELLSALGYDEPAVDELRGAGVIA
jgi:alpha-methylacyl-CoA racemase